MNRQAPSAARILTMVAFAASCIGLLLFLWISFGGTTSLSPRGYEISAEFDQAENLGSQADVRISGVNVGKVISVGLDRHTGLTRAVMEIDPQFAPRPADTRAILRQKTLLGETYVELSPGSPTGPKLADGARLPQGTDRPDRAARPDPVDVRPGHAAGVRDLDAAAGDALTGRGQDLNAALAELYPFATNVDSVLAVLNRDSAATSTLLHDGGRVLAAVTRSPAALQQLVDNANTTFSATAAQANALAATIKAFPPFLNATKTTIDRVERFSVTTKPLVDELRPAAVQLSPALESLAVLAPQLKSLLVNIGPLTSASKAGVPALEEFLNDSVPLLTRLTPYLGGVIPVVDYINTYRREVAAFFANGTAAAQATSPAASGHKLLHYVRVSSPLNPETLTDYSHRLESNRGNPYLVPGGYSSLVSQLPVFGSSLCTSTLSRRWPYYLGLSRRGAELGLLHRGPQRAAVQGPAAARRGDRQDRHRHFPNYNQSHEHGRLCFNTHRSKEESIATNRRSCHGTRRAYRRSVGLRRQRRPQHLHGDPEVLAEQGGLGQEPVGARIHPEVRRRRHQRKPHRAADRHHDQDLRRGLGREGVPDLQPDARSRRPGVTTGARRARSSPPVRSPR